ncbi:hypothetical protein [Propionivibrio dicarboxylicus]|uniref:Uncharacterized protein n=1 Tax=Propionivibrio dicarboxylicus TaxID=83767 RepID=A0A1G8ANX8_9RHOO|nr:hypothetical protein [Propionivibrio dicarboxylicus]SDH22668.1 hypothetical protein SAMN05660652_01450 [Propionivibrio dicarboxylicus]
MLKVLKSKTIVFSIALAILSVLQGYIGLLPLDQKGQAIAGIVIAVVVTILRAITTQPLSDK